MGTYKVPQDVEAEDKLLGPFSFRQFVYLMIVGLMAVLAWGLGTVFLPLAIIPLPIIVFFGAIALPLRKDQPMETYLAAIVKFYLLPKKRIWQPDGIESLIEITAPKKVETPLAKNISETEAEKQIGYLATLVDTGGWSTRGVGSAINSDIYAEASTASDVMDTYDPLSQSIDQLMSKKTTEDRQELIEMFKSGKLVEKEEEIEQTAPPSAKTLDQNIKEPNLDQIENAYASSQSEPSPDIIKLATDNADLTVDLIAKQAQRVQEEREHEGEIYIALR